MNQGRFISTFKEGVTDAGVNAANMKLVSPGTLLLSFKLSIGKVGFAQVPLYTNEAIAALKDLRSDVDPNYLYWTLQHIDLLQGVDRAAKGATLNKAKLKKVRIPLPPLPEQRRISAILDQADALRAKRREAIAKCDQLLQSVFLDMFGDPVTNPKGWPTAALTEIGTWYSGGTPSKQREDYWGGAIPWVSPKDMKVPKIRDTVDHVTQKAFEQTSLKLLNPGHLLIVVRGMILAHSFPTAINTVPIAINQDMKAIRLRPDIDVHFAQAAVDALKGRILSIVSTAGHGTRRLDTRDASEVLVPVPPKQLQSRYVDCVRAITVTSAAHEKALALSETMFASLQHRAFSGQLSQAA
jgi:type I restriction enzyme S subunit